MTIRLEQETQYRRKDWWFWSVWVSGTEAELDRVESVTYFLHPSFPNPIRTITDRATSFRLDAAGWGEFEIRADVRMQGGEVLRCTHYLTLAPPDEARSIGVPSTRTVEAAVLPGAARSETDRPVVFITGSSADGGVVSALGSALETRGIQLVDEASALDPGLPWEASIGNTIRSSDVTVAIISDVGSRFVEAEIGTADALQRDVVPIVVGADTPVPPYLERRQVLRIRDEQDVEAIANELDRRIRSATSREY